jgi:hypothetical protein
MATLLQSRIIQHAMCRFGIGSDTVIVEGFLIGGLNSQQNPFIQARDCAGVPRVGQQYADDGLLICQGIEPRPFKNSKDKIWVLATFRPYDYGVPINQPIIEMRNTSKTTLRTYDANGNAIKIKYTSDGTGGEGGNGTPPTDGVTYPDWSGQIQDTAAVACLHAEWVEYEDPENRLFPLTNAINSSPFRGRAKWTWWVSSLTYRKIKYQAGWHIVLDLAYDPQTHLQTIPYRDRFGIIPPDVNLKASATADPGTYNGYVRGTIKPSKDLSQLQIPVVT